MIPSTHIGWFTTSYKSSCRGFDTSGLLEYLYLLWIFLPWNIYTWLKIIEIGPSVEIHAFNLSTWRQSWRNLWDRDQPGIHREFQVSKGYIMRLSSNKQTKNQTDKHFKIQTKPWKQYDPVKRILDQDFALILYLSLCELGQIIVIHCPNLQNKVYRFRCVSLPILNISLTVKFELSLLMENCHFIPVLNDKSFKLAYFVCQFIWCILGSLWVMIVLQVHI